MDPKLPKDEETIVAIATPPGEGGIGVVRLSGPEAPKAMERIWRGKRAVGDLKSHHLYHGSLVDPGTEEVLDEVLLVWMKAPRSFTGEDVLEIHAHGGPWLLNKIQEVLLGLGLRPAEPGEFTRRAFLHGRLDLLQAEAVAAAIHAQSEAALRNAQGQLQGRLSEQVEALRGRLIDLLARVEAAIDFPEEDIEMIDGRQSRREVESLLQVLRTWLDKFQMGRLLREGVKVALVGRPNVGKSSLLNRLLGEPKAIVHQEPGTTRDVVEGYLQLDGVGFQFFDTAGMRQGKGEVEQEGIRRSRRIMARADLVLWVLDVSEPLHSEDRDLLPRLGGNVLVVGNKADLPVVSQDFPPSWPLAADLRGGEWHLVSARTGEGMEGLQVKLLRAVGMDARAALGEAYLNNARHREALTRAITALERAREALACCYPPECLAADLREATGNMEALLGEVSQEDVLDKIFREFCLGK